MKTFFAVLFNEFMSHFVPQRMKYEITGTCHKCGKCCRYLYCRDVDTEREFKIMQFLYPSYRRFSIIQKDEDNNLVLACKYVTEDGLCSVYKKRPSFCRRYPAKRINYPGKLHEGCGYKVEQKNFQDYLN